MNDSELLSIEIRVFAGIREAVGAESIRIAVEEIGAHATAAGVKHAIVAKYPALAPLVSSSRVAIGHTFVADQDRLELDLERVKTIALIPPVSGG